MCRSFLLCYTTINIMTIHFIGIGGIGVSALAKYYLKKGWRVSGCDLARSEITDQLKKMGAHIRIGDTSKIDTCIKLRDQYSQIVYSPAVPKNHPERAAARKQGIHELSYPQALGELTRSHCTIAISGTHGKSTTTSMIGLLLEKAGLDPTVIVGTKLKEFGNSNCRVGKSEFLHKGKPVLVIEADEHFASFMNYWPDMIVLTTIEADHLDYYKNIENILRSFQAYVSKLPEDGIIVANKDDKNVVRVASSSKRDIQYYSSKWAAARELRKIMQVPGEYNVANAHAALTVARALLVSDATSYAALAAFQGTWRRFETFALQNPVPYTLVSDYGYHPTEVRVTVEAARAKWPQSKLWLVFQPHQYQRTYYFFRDFANILARLPVDKLILADIYDVPGGEVVDITDKVSSEKLAHEIQKRKGKKLAATVLWIPALNKIYDHLLETLEGGAVVMVMGAGSIYDLAVRLTGELQKG